MSLCSSFSLVEGEKSATVGMLKRVFIISCTSSMCHRKSCNHHLSLDSLAKCTCDNPHKRSGRAHKVINRDSIFVTKTNLRVQPETQNIQT